MPDMVDPLDTLRLFQQALLKGLVNLQRGTRDPELFVHLDHPKKDVTRLTYVRLQDKIVTALVAFVITDPIDGIPCFHIGYAVPESYRGRGLAKNTIEAAIVELKNGMARNAPPNAPGFYIEAVIKDNNEISRHIAEQLISNAPKAITDSVSGSPAFQYLRKVEFS